jgi:hypothetical protein
LLWRIRLVVVVLLRALAAQIVFGRSHFNSAWALAQFCRGGEIARRICGVGRNSKVSLAVSSLAS